MHRTASESTSDVQMTFAPSSSWRQRVARWFEVDARSLAALRVGLALTMLWDLCSRGSELVKFFGDDGLAPRALFMPPYLPWLKSVYFISGRPGFIAAMFALHATFVLMFLIGFRTLLATIGCLLMYWSLVNRNVMATHSGDGLMIWLLIWSIFLPMGAAASVDRAAAGAGPKSVRSFASAVILIQVVYLYLGAFISKLPTPEWRSEFSAVYYFLSSHLGTPLGHAIAKYTFVCILLTITTMVLELVGPFVALASPGVPWLRTTMVVIFIFFHICLGATLYVGTFAYICAVAWLPYIPGETWDCILSTRMGGAIARAWGRQMSSLARALRPLAPRTIAWPRSTIAMTASVALFAYVSLVNLRVNLPKSIARYAGVVNKLPQAKQTWGVMHLPPHMATRLTLKAHLADGSAVTLMESGAQWPNRLSTYLWPPSTAREMKYRQEALMCADHSERQYVDAMCAYYQRQWDATHAPLRRVASIDASCAFQDIVQLDVAHLWEGGSNELVLYTWTPPQTRAQ